MRLFFLQISLLLECSKILILEDFFIVPFARDTLDDFVAGGGNGRLCDPAAKSGCGFDHHQLDILLWWPTFISSVSVSSILHPTQRFPSIQSHPPTYSLRCNIRLRRRYSVLNRIIISPLCNLRKLLGCQILFLNPVDGSRKESGGSWDILSKWGDGADGQSRCAVVR